MDDINNKKLKTKLRLERLKRRKERKIFEYIKLRMKELQLNKSSVSFN